MPGFVNPFELSGQWFRGNTHTHTTASDGVLDLESRCAAYEKAGYDFLVITDHRVAGPDEPPKLDKLLVVPGIELHPPNPYGGELFHLVCMNVREHIDADRMHPNQAIQAVRAQGGLAALAHPYWTGHTLTDMLPLAGIYAVEVYNDTCRRIGRPNSEPHWDMLLERGHRVFGLAADDAHYDAIDCFAGWVMVKAERLSVESVCGAIELGAFYATTGPVIEDLRIVPADSAGSWRIRVRCSPARQISFVSLPASGASVYAPAGQTITEAEHVVRADRPNRYYRIEVIDAAGRKAWANPIFLDWLQ